MIQEDRISYLNEKNEQDGKYIIYWMQASQRVHYNQALETAIRVANQRSLPLLVYFEIRADFPEANLRHYYFMLQGLQGVKHRLNQMGINMIINSQNSGKYRDLSSLAKDAAMVITDCGYLRFQIEWRDRYAQELPCLMIQVESDVIIPVESASNKEEFAIASFRRKTKRLLADYLKPIEMSEPAHSSLNLDIASFPLDDLRDSLNQLSIDGTVLPSPLFQGGEEEADTLLDEFIEEKIYRFTTLRNNPAFDFLSNMSPYLHFGQISPLYITLRLKTEAPSEAYRVYIEELIVKRELAINYVYYNNYYDQFRGLPRWAKSTLEKHQNDTRKTIYSIAELEHALTGDPYWNAAQQEMMKIGKMHGYMRTYWAKKILEWSPTPQEAFQRCLYLNNKYELDGRDPNTYTGIAQCFGLHDRAWKERPVYGKVRYMDEKHLTRKFDMEKYVEKVKELRKMN
jgi:deoxyribodipyrimidine photo-lyase